MTEPDIEYIAEFRAGTRFPIRVNFKCDPGMGPNAVEERARMHLRTRTTLPDRHWDLHSISEVSRYKEVEDVWV